MKTIKQKIKKIQIKLTALIIFTITAGIPAAAQVQLKASVPEEFKNSLELEILASIAERLETELEVKEAPFARRLQYIKRGDADITAGLLKNKEREKYIYYIDPPYKTKSNKIFFVRKGEASLISKYDDLYKLTIGTNNKSCYFSRFDNDHELIKEPTRSFQQNIQKLIAGRIDAVIYTEGYGFLKLKDTNLEDKVETALYHYSEENPVYIGISRQSKLMSRKKDIEDVIQSMSETGEIDKIISDYYKSRDLPVPQYK